MDVILNTVYFIGAIVPALYASWQGVRRVKRIQFGLPELLVLPLILTPTILGVIYTDIELMAIVAVYAAYHLAFAFNLWTTVKPATWEAAILALTGVILGTAVFVIWVFVIIFVCMILKALFSP
jgi:hypothetical protein